MHGKKKANVINQVLALNINRPGANILLVTFQGIFDDPVSFRNANVGHGRLGFCFRFCVARNDVARIGWHALWEVPVPQRVSSGIHVSGKSVAFAGDETLLAGIPVEHWNMHRALGEIYAGDGVSWLVLAMAEG